MQTSKSKPYRVFHRTWWQQNPAWPDGLEPKMGNKKHIGFAETQLDAQKMCAQYNNAPKTKTQKLLSDKAEFEDTTLH